MGDYITTYSKVHFYIMEPRPQDIRIRDIAHALSLICRANGHFPAFYSVAQHSLACYYEAKERNYSDRVALACLLHDASEAYLSDLTRPVKKNMTMYRQVEQQLQTMIYEKFMDNAPTAAEMELIKSVDDATLFYEFLHFMGEELFEKPPLLLSDPSFAERPHREVEHEFGELLRRCAGGEE